MNDIQITGVDSSLGEVIRDDVRDLKQFLDNILAVSDQTIVRNLIEETEVLLEKAKDNSKTYQERYDAFDILNNSWFNLWEQYNTTPGAVDLVQSIHHLTDYSLAYTYLFLSLSQINEGRIGEYSIDSQRVVDGFLLLSEIIDVFVDYFSSEELKQIRNGAINARSLCLRDVREYFESDLKSSHIKTNLRAYSSLIVWKIDEQIQKVALSTNKKSKDIPEFLYDREEFARRGEEIYDTQIRPQVEENNYGRIVAIDIETGAFELADDTVTASQQLLEKYPGAQIWRMRIGHEAVYSLK
jgi:hypothetical protein